MTFHVMANGFGRLAPTQCLMLALFGGSAVATRVWAAEPPLTGAPPPRAAVQSDPAASSGAETAAKKTMVAEEKPADVSQWSTQDGSRAVRLRDGTSILLGPNTTVSQLPMVPVPLGIKDAAARVFCLELVVGTLDIEIATDKKPIYGVLVHAPRKVSAIVKAGRATFSAAPGATTVAARSGYDMSVSVSERWRTLRVGRAFTVNQGNPAGAQRTILRAPTAQIDRSVAFALGANTPSQRVSWQSLPGSLGYWMRLYRVNGSDLQLVRTERVTQTAVDLASLQPGHYDARVTAIDPSGIETAESLPLHLRLIGATLPEGAYATSTAVYLPPDAHVTFEHNDGLEMAYGGGNAMYVPAPPTLGLLDGKAVSVRLRQRGTTQEALLKLEPLDVDPRIVLAPSRPAWPGDPVAVRISLRRRNGQPLNDDKQYLATVSINAQPVKVEWKRSPGSLVASVEKPPFPGPWVLRVTVQDVRGRVLSHDFIEVAVEKRTDWLAAEGL